jgi:hypothetical protein
MQKGGLTMTTISTIAADTWSISIGAGWIVLMLIGMGLCFVFMLVAMWLMRDGHGWAMCSRWWQQETPPKDIFTGTPGQRPDQAVSPGSEA